MTEKYTKQEAIENIEEIYDDLCRKMKKTLIAEAVVVLQSDRFHNTVDSLADFKGYKEIGSDFVIKKVFKLIIEYASKKVN